jgi:hypothetical protein
MILELLLKPFSSIKTHFFTTPIFSILVVVAFSCAEPERSTKPNKDYQHNWKTWNLKGEPESVIEMNYKQFIPDSLVTSYVTREMLFFNDDGDLTSHTTYMEKEFPSGRKKYKYDDQHNATQVTLYDAHERVLSVQRFVFDSVGNVTEISNVDPKSALMYKSSWKYDKHGNPIEWKQVFPPSVLINKRKYAYDSLGRCVKKQDVHTGKFLTTQLIRYEDDGKKIETQTYRDSVLDVTTIEVFDDHHRLLSRLEKFPNKQLLLANQYDTAGNLIEYLLKENDEIDSLTSYRCQYQYDEKGNWIKRETKNLDGTPRTEVERKIKY